MEPTAEQRERIEKLVGAMVSGIDDEWGIPERVPIPGRTPWYYSPNEFDQRYAVSLERLLGSFSSDQFSLHCADIIAFPDSVRQDVMGRAPDDPGLSKSRLDVVQRIAVHWTLDNISDYALDGVIGCLRRLMTNPYGEFALDRIKRGDGFGAAERYFLPGITGYLDILCRFATYPPALQTIRDVVTGDLRIRPPDPATDAPGADNQRAYHYHSENFIATAREILSALEKAGLLDYATFARATEFQPYLIDYHHKAFNRPYYRSDGQEPLAPFQATLVWDLAQKFSAERAHLFPYYNGMVGLRFLFKAAEHLERLPVKKLTPLDNGNQKIEASLGRMAYIVAFEPDDDLDAAVQTLRSFKRETLELLMPAAGVASSLVLRALGDDDLEPLLNFVFALGHYPGTNKSSYEIDVRNSPDPTEGIVDVAGFQKLLAAIGEKRTKTLLKQIGATLGLSGALLLIEAVPGWNRAAVLKKLPKRSQIAVKAYGLLPIDGEAEVFERYLFIQRYAAESKKFGSQRQSAERAAAQVALANLAQVAGYGDLTRLEWAMEARLAEQATAPEAVFSAGEYGLALELEDGEPQLVVRRDGRVVKSPPATVRKSEAYLALKETVANLRAQASRTRFALERIMASGEMLGLGDLASLTQLPAGRAMLEQLVLLTTGGSFALFDTETQSFADEHGSMVDPGEKVSIAHPFHFFEAGRLTDWQREIVRRRIVQPFKQVFRELYVLTPAELQSEEFSNRFAGHLIDAKVANRLFQAREWQLNSNGDHSPPTKLFRGHGMKAVFEFPDAGHFLSETETITSDRIYFLPLHHRPRYPEPLKNDMIALADIPPIILSETLRDADLVVAVAQRGESGRLSEEAYARRGEMVRMLLEDLGLAGVELAGHFAHIAGKLARYRIHLGSGAIHIEPGNYLCIVPERWSQRPEKLFLPFADANDPKLSEIVSKVLLLLNDDKITDQSILRQIKQE